MRKFMLVLTLGLMFFFVAGVAHCPKNNLCDPLPYGSDEWAECMGLYGSDYESAPAPAPTPSPEPEPESNEIDHCYDRYQ